MVRPSAFFLAVSGWEEGLWGRGAAGARRAQRLQEYEPGGAAENAACRPESRAWSGQGSHLEPLKMDEHGPFLRGGRLILNDINIIYIILYILYHIYYRL